MVRQTVLRYITLCSPVVALETFLQDETARQTTRAHPHGQRCLLRLVQAEG